MKNFFLFSLGILFFFNAYSQLSLTTTGVNHTINFNNTLANVNNGTYTSSGSGVSSTPASGQLDTDSWSIKGLSSGDVNFSGTNAGSDYTRGTSGGGESTGGLYAFDIDNTGGIDRALGVQATGSDMTSGSITLKIRNNTPSVITSLSIDFEVHVLNNGSNSLVIDFSHSYDDLVYTDGIVDVETPGSASGSPAWVANPKSLVIPSLNIPIGSNYFLKWNIQNNYKTSSRDEVAIDDIVITPSSVACPLAAEPTTIASAIIANNITCDGANLSWVNGDGANNIVVVSTSPITGLPTDQITYNSIGYYGSSAVISAGEYVVYSGTENSFNLSGLTTATTYHIAIFEYNGNTCEENYFNTSANSSFSTGVCSDCPKITSVLVDGCRSGNCPSEGTGEFVMMSSGDHYIPIRRNKELLSTNVLLYGTSSPANLELTEVFGSGTSSVITDLNTAAGCNIFTDALSVDVIPSNSSMMFIKDDFCADSYNFSNLCGNSIYVFMSMDRSWEIGGSFKNYDPVSSNRYFRIDFSDLVLDGSCTTTDYFYDVSLFPGHSHGDLVIYGSGGTTYDNSCIPTTTILPISLTYFNVFINNSFVETNWETATEINNDYFTIEKSENGIDFKEVGVINGAGNSSTNLKYNLIDKTPYLGTSYYRLKQTDFDGFYSYSVIKSINFEYDLAHLKIKNLGNYYTIESLIFPVKITVFDISGRVIENKIINSENKKFTINRRKGSYIIHAQNTNNSISYKALIIK